MAETALKNMLDPGTHRCTWTLSKPPDTWSWEVAGDAELLAQRQPRGGVYGKAPADWAVSPSGRGQTTAWPQHFEYPTVYGELDGGLDVVLLDARLTVFEEEPRRGRGLSGSLAGERTYGGEGIQMGHLDDAGIHQ